MSLAVCTNQAGTPRQLAPKWFQLPSRFLPAATAHPIPCFSLALRHPSSVPKRQSHTLGKCRTDMTIERRRPNQLCPIDQLGVPRPPVRATHQENCNQPSPSPTQCCCTCATPARVHDSTLTLRGESSAAGPVSRLSPDMPSVTSTSSLGDAEESLGSTTEKPQQ